MLETNSLKPELLHSNPGLGSNSVSTSSISNSVSSSVSSLTDIHRTTNLRAQHEIPLNWVGMRDIELPVAWTSTDGKQHALQGRVHVGVSLDQPEAKGVHMSRLYAIVNESLAQRQDWRGRGREILRQCIETQAGLSSSGELQVSLAVPLKREALRSGLSGWRFYPLTLRLNGTYEDPIYELQFEVLYSSTCPCSAALARQSMAEGFEQKFKHQEFISRATIAEWLQSESAWTATPHAQRSRASVWLKSRESDLWNHVEEYIEQAEAALATPVQTAVRREDELAFAELNAENLMFCEDAARRLAALYRSVPELLYRVDIEHFESLHAHNAAAVVTNL